MKKLYSILFFGLSGLVTSCKVTEVQKEIYYVEKYPVEWHDTIIYQPEHFHYQDYNTKTWYCAYSELDTFYLHIVDTIEVTTLQRVEVIKRHN